jgi:FkbM family methyltransferase
MDPYFPVTSERWRWRRARQQHAAMRVVDRLLGEDDIALDIGANRGLFSAQMSLKLRRGCVYAFEPYPEHVARLQKMSRRVRNMVVYDVALSDESGTAELSIPVVDGTKFVGMGTLQTMTADVASVEVRTATLDEIFPSENERADFIKCDVEGHEDAVLKGGTRLLEQNRPHVLIELEQRHRSTPYTDTTRRLLDLGLDGWAIYEHGVRPLAEFDLERDQLQYLPGSGESMPPGYVTDFVFTRPGADLEALMARPLD